MSKNKVKIEFDTGNAAFDYDNGSAEAAQIVANVAKLLGEGYTSGRLHDSNGNAIGSWSARYPA